MEKRKRIFRKIRLGASIAALVAAVSVFAVMLRIEENVLSGYERVTVCAAAKEIPRGLVITEQNCEEYFRFVDTDKKCVSPAVLTDYKQFYGLIPVYDIEEGTLPTAGMFEAINGILKEMKEPVIAGFKADDLYQVVGGVLRAGDRIHIYTVTEADGAVLRWENVYVESVFDQSGQAIAATDKVTGARRINIYMAKSDTETFYTELADGSLRVVKVCE